MCFPYIINTLQLYINIYGCHAGDIHIVLVANLILLYLAKYFFVIYRSNKRYCLSVCLVRSRCVICDIDQNLENV